MNRKNLPVLLMLTAGVITCIITFVQQYSTLEKLVSLFIVLLIFYVLGSVMKWTLNYFEEQNEKQREEEGEVIEKSVEGQEGVQQEVEEEGSEEEGAEESEAN